MAKAKVDKKIVLGVLLSVLIGALAWQYQIAPMQDKNKALRIEIEQQKQELELNRTIAGKLQEEREKAEAWAEMAEFTAVFLPGMLEIPMLLDRVETRLRVSGITIESLSVKKPETDAVSGLNVVPVEVQVATNFDQFVALMRDLENSVNRVRLTGVNYTLSGASLEGRVSLRLYLDR